jgi:hypothetical protein
MANRAAQWPRGAALLEEQMAYIIQTAPVWVQIWIAVSLFGCMAGLIVGVAFLFDD